MKGNSDSVVFFLKKKPQIKFDKRRKSGQNKILNTAYLDFLMFYILGFKNK